MQPTPVFLRGKPHGQRAWQVTVHGISRVRHGLATRPSPEKEQVLTKQEILLGRGAGWRAVGRGSPRELPCCLVHRLSFCDDWDELLSSLWLIALTQGLPWCCIHCSTKPDASKKDSGRWQDMWCLLLTFPEFSGWWCPVFLTRTFCHKTTHTNGYFGCLARVGGFSQRISPNRRGMTFDHIIPPQSSSGVIFRGAFRN